MRERRLRSRDIPLLVIEPAHRARGTLLVFHGLLASKDTQRKELEALARRGFNAVGIDAVGHGERRHADLEARLDVDAPRTLLEIVGQTVDEVPGLLDDLAGGEPFGVTGISMGAYIAFAALVTEPRLRVGVPILGNPDWHALAPGRADLADLVARSPHLRPHAFAHKRVLAMNGGLDTNVPPAPARELMTVLQRHPGTFEYVEYAESSHFMRPVDWDDLWRRTEDWFGRWLAAGT